MWAYVWFVLSVIQLDQFHSAQHAFPAWVKQCGCLENQASECNQDDATEEYTKIACTEELGVVQIITHILKKCWNITLSATVLPSSRSQLPRQ